MRSQIRRTFTLLTLTLATAVAVAACGSSSGGSGGGSSAGSGAGAASGYSYGGSSSSGSGASSSASAGDSTLKLASTSKGKILVDSKGFTAYLFTADGHNSDRCQKTSGCLGVWPAIMVTGKPTAGSGVKGSLLGTTKLTDGRQQVTYAGHPLYGYTGDGSPASTGYIGVTSFGGTWLAVNVSGQAVH